MPKIIIRTSEGSDLRDDIIRAVGDGELPTWQIRTGTNKIDYLTHTGQWADRALLSFDVYDDKLEIVAVKWKEQNEDAAAKKYYVGRFTEMLLIHFSDYFTNFAVHK
ncbi:hypothetical protein [Mucilaginibacter sp. PAMB04168]|uniref:hypothetical protein n=1 Tax=Mucilaginibacter sp. PAMB04168 TaxID=3138567 RepID=UPI0031F6B5A9